MVPQALAARTVQRLATVQEGQGAEDLAVYTEAEEEERRLVGIRPNQLHLEETAPFALFGVPTAHFHQPIHRICNCVDQ